MSRELLVVWISWTCPGGLLSGLWPAAARPLVCRPVAAHEIYDPARQHQAERRALELGADLQACARGRCRSIKKVTTSVTFEEVQWDR
jgi:hypothetical protein